MRFRVLGEFSVYRDDEPVEIESVQVRALLAVLLLAPNQRGSHAYVASRLWPQRQWNSENIRFCCSKLRKILPGVMPDRNKRSLCEIKIARNSVDYLRFVDGLSAAREQSGRTRVESLRAALDEWGDGLLEDFPGIDLSVEKARLTKELKEAYLEYLRSMFDVCDLDEVLREARRAEMRWPGDDELFETVCRGLGGRGETRLAGIFYERWEREHGQRSDELLSICQRGIDERGLFEVPAAGSGRRLLPRQLPAHHPRIVGREAQLAELSEILLAPGTGTARLAVLTGMPGVGKTQLALSCATSLKDAFPDGVLYADLNGFGSVGPENPEQTLARFLGDLGVRPATPTLDGMIATYRSSVADRAILVVLDNARDANHVRPLLPGAGTCAAIVISRGRLDSLEAHEGARVMTVGPLTPSAATAFLAADLDKRQARPGGPYLNEIAEVCGGLPLALTIVAARARARPPEPSYLGVLLRELRSKTARLNSLQHRDILSVRAAFGMSYEVLSPGAKRMFQRLAIHPGPTISQDAVEVLADDRVEVTRGVIEELLAAHLLQEPEFGRFAYHDLIRDYATELAEEMDPAERMRTVELAFGYLLRWTRACDRVLDPERTAVGGRPTAADSGDGSGPTTLAEAMEWLDDEYSTVTAAVLQAKDMDDHHYTWQLSMALVTYQWRRGRYTDAERYLGYSASAAEKVAGPTEQAMVNRMIAGSRRGLGKIEKAKGNLHRAVMLSELAGDALGVARARHGLAVLHHDSGKPQAAIELFEQALAGFQNTGNVVGEAGARNGLGCARHDLGDYDGALRHCGEAVQLFEATSDLNGTANALASLGKAHAAKGEHALAITNLGNAADRYRSLTYRSREARTLVDLGELLVGTGRIGEARDAYLRAEQLLRELDDPTADEAAARLADLG
ncbi:tetratricopeptide repeat protein [Parafrankia sp. BMG5.11]|uniref:AfsR/SARP family transcriptional regulator n=1 Tax=Parafrankia sp. BMG5.11 TaxID=222540 RepID=UPI00103B074B|nr:tetratricopeptide repeat protein [Parafrankia sp. BMG5.11]TCJ32981.1 tetratricopeptide repeat protein [Parafrankia sp. BMG5.11]